MLEKGTMRSVKKILGWIIGIIGVLLIVSKESTLNFISNTGLYVSNFYFSILAILLVISAYFLVIAGRQS